MPVITRLYTEARHIALRARVEVFGSSRGPFLLSYWEKSIPRLSSTTPAPTSQSPLFALQIRLNADGDHSGNPRCMTDFEVPSVTSADRGIVSIPQLPSLRTFGRWEMAVAFGLLSAEIH